MSPAIPNPPADSPLRATLTPALRGLAVRRLSDGLRILVGVALVGLVGWAAGGWRWPVAVGMMGGAVVSAGALLVMGQRAVWRAFGLERTGLRRLSGVARLVPAAWALWLFAIPGVVQVQAAFAARRWVLVAIGTAVAYLALRVIVTAHRVGELETLAVSMVTPAPEESAPPPTDAPPDERPADQPPGDPREPGDPGARGTSG